MTPDAIYALMEEHQKCLCLVYYFQRHVTGKPVDEQTRYQLRHVQQMDRILKSLKLNNRI